MAAYTGPVMPDWRLFDDDSGRLLAVIKRTPASTLPRVGEILHDVDKHIHWAVSKIGELHAEDLNGDPPLLYYAIYGHGA